MISKKTHTERLTGSRVQKSIVDTCSEQLKSCESPRQTELTTVTLERMLEESRLELHNLKDQLRTVERKYDDICNSLIWRKTKWLRDLLDYAKDWRQFRSLAVDSISELWQRMRSCGSDFHRDWTGEVRSWQGNVAIVQSAFAYDETLNQRPLNLAGYLARRGFLVIFVVWQWNEKEKLKNSYRFVAENILQIPYYDFLDHSTGLERRLDGKGYLFVTFPSEGIVNRVSLLRSLGYSVVYDIMDDWEEFSRVGQAIWYDRPLEEQAVLAADLVTAVSGPLRAKFDHLRSDIRVVGNGLSPSLLGPGHKNCSKSIPNPDGTITVGYVGHMTDSWFDWDAVFMAAEENPLLHFEFIGYGASAETQARLGKSSAFTCHGKVPPDFLHEYVKNWHVAIIPFKEAPLARGVDPIKVYEYLYFGLPVVVTGVQGVAGYPGVIYCNSAEELGHAIVAAYNARSETLLNPAEVDAFLEEKTWDQQFSSMLAYADSAGLCGLYA